MPGKGCGFAAEKGSSQQSTVSTQPMNSFARLKLHASWRIQSLRLSAKY